MDGINVVGVQFRRAGKLYDFSIGELDLRVGDHVVVETDRGPSLAQVAMVKFSSSDDLEGRTLKPILRKASQKELKKEGRLLPEDVSAFTKDKVKTLKLNMRVLKSEVQFGGNKVIVYFTAPGRVDFRELVKELAGGLKTRVELKQVGARDETKLIGGIGVCGREFCCSSFLREFVPVSIRMAKNQNLALNPSKVSGGCGRLCCLTYEDEAYQELRKKIPPKGTRVRLLERGDFGDVIKGDLLNQMLYVETDEGQMVTVKLAETEIVEKGTGEEAAAPGWGDDLNLDELTDEMAHAMEDDGSGSGIDGDVDDGAQQARRSGPKGGDQNARGPRGPRQQSGDRQSRPQGGGRHKKGQYNKGRSGRGPRDDRSGKPRGDQKPGDPKGGGDKK